MKKLNIRIPVYPRIAEIAEGKNYYCSPDDLIITQDGKVFINPNGNASSVFNPMADLTCPIEKKDGDVIPVSLMQCRSRTYLYESIKDNVKDWYAYEVTLDADIEIKENLSIGFPKFEYELMAIEQLLDWLERWIFILSEGAETENEFIDISNVNDVNRIIDTIKTSSDKFLKEELIYIAKIIYDLIWEDNTKLNEESDAMLTDLLKIICKRLVQICGSEFSDLDINILMNGDVDLKKLNLDQLEELLTEVLSPPTEDYDYASRIREEIKLRK